MKSVNIAFIAGGLCTAVIGLGLWALTSSSSAYADPRQAETSAANSQQAPVFFADAGDETAKSKRDIKPDTRPAGRFFDRPERRGPGPRDGEGNFGPPMDRDSGMDPYDDDRDRPGMGRHGRGMDEGGFRQFLTPAEIDELMDFIKEKFPNLYDQLKTARETDEHSFFFMLRRVGGPIFQIIRVGRDDPALAETMIAEHKVRMEIFKLQRDYRDTETPAEKETIKTALREQLQKRFEARQQRLKLEIENLRKRLDEQARRLAESEQNKNKLIDDEFNNMIDRMDEGGFF